MLMIEREHAGLSLTRQCRLLELNRSSLYYRPVGESAETLALMRRIDELYLQYPFYGSRQMVRHLARAGVRVGRHRVRRLMRLLGLEAIYRKPRTSVANPEHRVYPYLLRGLTIDRPNQVWCADITYIPVQGGFLYLVAIMDWASRRVLAWRLSNTMDTEFCLAVLAEALESYGIPEIFNTDQGRPVSVAVLLADPVPLRLRGHLAGRSAAHAHRARRARPGADLDEEGRVAWSYDGKAWHRNRARTPFIARGGEGRFDSVWLNLPTNPPIVNYNQLWFYYSGRAGGHGAQFPEAYGAIGLATLRVDGFCSLRSGEAPGGVLTKPVTWPGGELLVNADPRRDISGHHSNDTSPGGQVAVEIRDADNRPLDGFGFADCNPITRNTRIFEEQPSWSMPDRDKLCVHPVTWQDGRSARQLAGKRVRLFFKIQDAHLYSFRASSS